MAKYLLASMVDRPLGAVGGAVFQKQGGVFTIRNHSRPIDKKSIRQYVQRNRFASIQQRFRNLTGPQQTTWNNEAVNYPKENSLGDTYYVTGPNLQQSSNTFGFISGAALLDSMPSPEAVTPFTWDTIAFAEPLDIFDLVTDPATVPVSYNLVIYATRPVSPGSLTSQTPYVFLGVVPGGFNTSLINWFDAYITLFGAVNDKIGSQIFVVGHYLPLSTYQPGIAVYGSGFVEN